MMALAESMDDKNNRSNISKRQPLASWDELLECSAVVPSRIGHSDDLTIVSLILKDLPQSSPLAKIVASVVRPQHNSAAEYFDGAMKWLYRKEYRKAANELKIVQQFTHNANLATLRGLILLEQVNLLLERNRLQDAIINFRLVERLIPNLEATQEMRLRLVSLWQESQKEQSFIDQIQQEERNEYQRWMQELQQGATERVNNELKRKAKAEQTQRNKERQLMAARFSFERAEEAEKQGNWQQVLLCLKQACQFDQDNDAYREYLSRAKKQQAGIHFNNANNFLKKKLFDDALNEINRAVTLVPQDNTIAEFQKKVKNQKTACLLFEKAKEAAKQNSWQQVILHLEQARHLDPSNNVYWEHLATAKKQQQASIHLKNAKEASKQNNWRQVISQLEQACQFDPDSGIYREYLMKAKKQQASIHFKKAKEFFRQKLFDDALKEANDADTLMPRDTTIAEFQAEIIKQIGFQQKLPQTLETAKAYLSGGYIKRARNVYHSILDDDPNSIPAQDGLVACRRMEVKRKLWLPSRLLYMQWFFVNGLAFWGIINGGMVGWVLVVPFLLFCGPLLKGISLSSLRDSRSLRVTLLETIYCLLIYFPFGWLGIFWAKMVLALDPTIKDMFNDKVSIKP